MSTTTTAPATNPYERLSKLLTEKFGPKVKAKPTKVEELVCISKKANGQVTVGSCKDVFVRR